MPLAFYSKTILRTAEVGTKFYNMAKAIKVRRDDTGVSVLLRTKVGLIWFDLFQQGGEWTGDWNQYIHHMWKEEDIKRKLFQEDTSNYLKCMEEAFRAADLPDDE